MKKCIIFLLLTPLCFLCIPIGVIVFLLPHENEISEGKKANELFSKLNSTSTLEIISKAGVPSQGIECVQCFPHDKFTFRCFAGYFTRQSRGLILNKNEKSNISFDFFSLFFGTALKFKYSEEVFRQLYFSSLQGFIFVKNFQEFCQSKFMKNCNELSPSELVVFDSSLANGLYRPVKVKNLDIILEGCKSYF